MTARVIISFALIFLAGVALCQEPKLAKPPKPPDTLGLKHYYSSLFPIGVAVTPQSLVGDQAVLIRKHFNSLTAENAMKMGNIHPAEGEFNWEPADKIVAFAQANKMKMRGHTLVWHNQVPDWIFKYGDGPVSRDVLLNRMKEHINAVVSRYKGKIYAWDVVNEAIDDQDSVSFRHSPWFDICGEEYISKAFEYAHEADPDALLFYNDYNTENPVKREKIYKLLKGLIDKKVPIHGVGLQGHWSIFKPTAADVDESVRKFASLGLQIQITELDVSVYASEPVRRERKLNEAMTFTKEMEEKQLSQYVSFFKVFSDNHALITGVTFWNVSDRSSWLDNYPVRGRKNYPLLFDRNLQPKKVYFEVIRTASKPVRP